ncbi:MAG: hypothetical protein IAC08_01390 [Bacteroidetes bacterium]|uniref:Uncharacterized protein n=1 Tax=Candidatus Cryptobacteroides intestinigallinarum TaxID=2840767 RepID=A0A9D9MZ42_9BACT|nr:hypothetical protein [Candidatus Cryptobacteroides intestinigallinarum]
MDYNKEERRYSVCLECGDEIHYGRQDRKFCCEACKNRYNNRKTRSSRNTRLRVMNALDRNYRLLDRLLKLGMDSLDLVELRHMGFEPSYVTSYRRLRCHDEFCCFDIRFIMTATKICSLSRLQSPFYKSAMSDGASSCRSNAGVENPGSVKKSVNSHSDDK